MSSDIYENLKKLVIFLETILSPKINMLNQAENLIQEFVKELTELYDERIMLSGVHELLHLVDCTILFGPLNSINLYQFEELNRVLISFSHGFDLIGEEILKIFSTSRILLNYTQNISNIKIKTFVLKHLNLKSSNKKKLNENENVTSKILS